MGRSRRILYIGLALLLAVSTVFFTQRWLQGEVARASATASESTTVSAVQVLVARRTLPIGTILKPDDLDWQPWPADAALDNYLTREKGSAESLAGSVLKTELAPGEPVMSGSVVDPQDRSFLAAVLQPGFRAVTIEVSAATGVAGFIRPGDRVDLILSRVIDNQGGGRRVLTDTVLQNVRVLGIDQRAGTSEENEIAVPQTATIEVTPKQAEAVAGAGELGRLSLALRSLALNEADPQDTGAISPMLSFDAPAPQPVRAPRPARPSPVRASSPPPLPPVEVVRGSRSSESGNR